MAACVALALVAPARPARAENHLWPGQTAYTVPPGRLEMHLLGPWRYALGEELELSGHLLAMMVWPNAGLKWALPSSSRAWAHALRVRLSLPGITLGLIDWTERVPEAWPVTQVALEADLMSTLRLGGGYHFTVAVGALGAPAPGAKRPALRRPLVWPRVGQPDTLSARASARLDGYLGEGVYWDVSAQLWVMAPGSGWALEPQAMLRWRWRYFSASAGARGAYNVYPDGSSQLGALPWIDVGVAME